MSPQSNHQIGLTLQADPVAIGRIFESGIVRKSVSGTMYEGRSLTVYHDTPYHTLRKAGLSLWVRREGKRHHQAVEQLVAGPPGLRSFRRWREPLANARPDASAVDDSLVRSALKWSGRDKRLAPIFSVDARQNSVSLVRDGNPITLTASQGRIVLPSGQWEGVSEIELEAGDATSICDLALQLIEIGQTRVGYPGLADRGYALARPALKNQFRKATNPPLRPEMSVSDAFCTIVNDALRHLRANETAVAIGQPEGIHQARVAIRRIRATLMVFEPRLARKRRKKFNREFRRFQRQLSPARDWYVLLDETLPSMRRAMPGKRTAIGRLREIANLELARTSAGVAGLFEGREYTRLLLEFLRWLAVQHEAIDDTRGHSSLIEFASERLDATHSELMKYTRPLSRMTAGERHTLRKRGKKARYACEFFASLWPGRQTAAYLASMKRLQDSLGQINDYQVAGHLHLLLQPGQLDPRLQQLLETGSATAIRQCNRVAQPAWRRLQRREPFWRGEAGPSAR